MRSSTAIWWAGVTVGAALLVGGLCGSAARADDGELFPGVPGITGDELTRRCQEYEKKHPSAPEPARTTSQPATPAPVKVKPPADATPPKDPPSGDPATKSPSDTAKSPADTTKPATAAAKTTPEAPVKTAATSKTSANRDAPPPLEPADFLADLAGRRKKMALFIKVAKDIREEANTASKSCGWEPAIHYYLRNHGDAVMRGQMSVPTARKYAETLLLPISIYRYIVVYAGEAQAFSIKRRPEQLSAAEAQQADDDVKSMLESRREPLLASAELFTQIRRLPAAAKIYEYLLHEYPGDAAIKRSYQTIVAVRNEPQPASPPLEHAGTSTTGHTTHH